MKVNNIVEGDIISNSQSLNHRIKMQLELGKKQIHDKYSHPEKINQDYLLNNNKNTRKDTLNYSNKKGSRSNVNNTICISNTNTNNDVDTNNSFSSSLSIAKNIIRKHQKLVSISSDLRGREVNTTADINTYASSKDNLTNNNSYVHNEIDQIIKEVVNNNNHMIGNKLDIMDSRTQKDYNDNDGALIQDLMNRPKIYIEKNDELKANGQQREIVKKIMGQLKDFQESIDDCSEQILQRVILLQRELREIKNENKDLKEQINQIKLSYKEYDNLLRKKNEQISDLKFQIGNNNNNLSVDPFYQSNISQNIGQNNNCLVESNLQNPNLIDNKNKTQARFIKPRHSNPNNISAGLNNENQYFSAKNDDRLLQKLTQLQYENSLLRNENKSLWLQNRKAIELAIESKNAKIMKFGLHNEKNPIKSPTKGLNAKENPIPNDSFSNGQENKNYLSNSMHNFIDCKESHNISFGQGANIGITLECSSNNNSMLQRSNQPRKTSSFPNKKAFARTQSVESVKSIKQRKTVQPAFK